MRLPMTGQTLRRLGLIAEAACLFGLIALSRGRLPAEPFPGWPRTALLLQIGLGLGFILWAAGTLRIYWPAGRRRGAEVRDGD